MSPEIGKAATRIALFLLVAAGLSLLWVRWGSAEFVVLVLTIGIAVLLLGAVAVLARLSSAPWGDRPAAREGGGEEDDEGGDVQQR